MITSMIIKSLLLLIIIILFYFINIQWRNQENYLNQKQIKFKKTLEDMANILEDNNIYFFLYCGTALGATREKKFIEHDPDIDISIAKFRTLRAFFFYLAMDNYGDIPLVTSFKDAEEFPSKATRQEVYDFVVAELEASVPLLPSSANDFAVSQGMPTAIAALIVTLQPILTNALSGPILGEKVSFNQWLGVMLGFVGAAMVLGIDVGDGIPLTGFIATVISLIAITTSTIWQKKLSNNLPLSVSNFYQAVGGLSFHLLVIIFFIDPYINFTKTFIIAMSHQIFLVSFGAFTILMYLIKKNSASKTVSIFFLIPPTSALMAWVFLNEKLNTLDIFGFIVASVGVYIATRNKI